ncbi:MAG: HAD family hydrolase [Methanohalobium sp.]|uniref:HAD family hydrolase n=1 Tax=Methanohalobium sp. TaxID=2837493 RepID=UPI00397E7CD7
MLDSNIKGIVFDCYNTLLDIKAKEDSIGTYERVSNWLLYKGVRINPVELKNKYIGKILDRFDTSEHEHPEIRVEDVFADICRENAFWDIDERRLGFEAAQMYRSAAVRHLDVFPQSSKLLENLKHMPLCIVSNGQRSFSEFELKFLGLYDYFDHVIFSSDFGYRKPDTRLFQTAVERMGLQSLSNNP